MFKLFGTPSAKELEKATDHVGGNVMSKIKSDLEKAGKRELLAVLVFLIAECGVQIGTVSAGDETKLIIKDTSKMRDALDRKLEQDNAELDKQIEALDKRRKRNDEIIEKTDKEIMDFINALPNKKK